MNIILEGNTVTAVLDGETFTRTRLAALRVTLCSRDIGPFEDGYFHGRVNPFTANQFLNVPNLGIAQLDGCLLTIDPKVHTIELSGQKQ
jgi:hypothetical protein